jgi:hypothetical protein
MDALKQVSARSAARALSRCDRAVPGARLVRTTVGPLVRSSLPDWRARGDGIHAAELVGWG